MFYYDLLEIGCSCREEKGTTDCTVALTLVGSVAEIQILFSFHQSDESSSSLVTSQLEHRNTSLYKFHSHFQGLDLWLI